MERIWRCEQSLLKANGEQIVRREDGIKIVGFRTPAQFFAGSPALFEYQAISRNDRYGCAGHLLDGLAGAFEAIVDLQDAHRTADVR